MGVAESTAAVQTLLNLALAGDYDGLLEYVPDAAMEHALQRKRIFRSVSQLQCRVARHDDTQSLLWNPFTTVPVTISTQSASDAMDVLQAQ